MSNICKILKAADNIIENNGRCEFIDVDNCFIAIENNMECGCIDRMIELAKEWDIKNSLNFALNQSSMGGYTLNKLAYYLAIEYKRRNKINEFIDIDLEV